MMMRKLSDREVTILRLAIAKQAAKDYSAAYKNFRKRERELERVKGKPDRKYRDAKAKLKKERNYLHSGYFELLIDSTPDRLIRLLEEQEEQKFI